MQNSHIIKGTLLVAGTAIGGGMLALPVLTSLTGYLPSLIVYLLCWFFMASTGLILLEVTLWMEEGVNIISMAERTLGKFGKISVWFLYLFLFYCLTLAYIVGCGDLITEIFSEAIPEWLGALVFLILFVPLVYAGAHVVGKVNLYLMVGLGISYLLFVILGVRHINPELLAYRNWNFLCGAFPIAFTAFAYQGIIPTLVNYMERNVRELRLAILIGSFLPLIIYFIWQTLILGIVPVFGAGGLAEALEQGEDAINPLKNILEIPGIYVIGQFFAFFALVTSFLGVTLGLVDFLADGLSIEKDRRGKILLSLLVFVPPLIISYIKPGVFLIALDLAGGFGCALLLGLIPILMLWSGRYYLGLKGPYTFSGGRILLTFLILFVVFEILCQLL